MFNPLTVIGVFFVYMALLFVVALWVERRSLLGGKSWADHPLVYSLSLAVYCSSWTYYGSVGKAVTSGPLFLAIYLGPTLSVLLWWTVLRKLVRIKSAYRITSIADFISTRYNRSQGLAILVTGGVLLGSVPYIALQLKSVISTFAIISHTDVHSSWTAQLISRHIGAIVVVAMSVFTIVFGVRRIDPTERHPGMVMAVALVSLVKLVAFLSAGILVTYFLYDGFGDIFQRLSTSAYSQHLSFAGRDSHSTYLTWTSYMVLSMSAVLFLPRQFHVAVVENSNEKHILSAMWLFPLYLLLINIFVIPITMGGLLRGLGVEQADNFVLLLPMGSGHPILTLLVFIGGFSAATGMIMILTMTLATMATNHLLLPLVEGIKGLGFLRRRVLECRWVTVFGCIFLGYWFERQVGHSYMLVNIGIISFAAALQFAPAILVGIFWRRANKIGATLGISAGLVLWSYTLFLPALVKSGWMSADLLKMGLWGIAFLKPEQLFGLTQLDPVSHSIFWSMFFNLGLLVFGSLGFRQSEEERCLAESFVAVLGSPMRLVSAKPAEATIKLLPKKQKIQGLLSQYFSDQEGQAILDRCTAGLKGKKWISIMELVQMVGELEKCLAGSFGSATAHGIINQANIYSAAETQLLTAVYGEILARMHLGPEEMKEKIDYYRERERLLIQHAEELEKKIAQRDRNIAERERAEEEKKKLEEQLRFAQKMEALGTLAGGIAHDFNNLLTGVLGNASLMLLNTDSSHPHYEMLKSIERQVQAGTTLTRQLLGYTRQGRYEVKPISLNQLVEEIVEPFARTRKEVTIRQDLAEDLWAIEADRGQIEQVLLNLFINAADAMPGGGDLVLKTMNTTHEHMNGRKYEPKPGKYVLLKVTDSGIGMDEETVARVFDPFFTTKERGRGTGLGLASVYGIVKGHGGYIEVYSRKGQETTFSLYLPATEKKVEEGIKTAEGFMGGTETVLLVDDEEIIREVGQELLKAMGYRVLLARGGEEALEIYRKNQKEIDIVLLDMVMPGMGGGKTYDRLKAADPDIKVLLLSGYSVDGQAGEILQRGCNGFIQKPFTAKELSGKIREILTKG